VPDADPVVAGPPAGVVKDAPGLLRVVGPLGALGEPGAAGGNRAVGGGAGAGEDAVDHQVAVGGEVEGAADGAVAGHGVAGREGHGAVVGAVRLVRDHALLVGEVLGQLGRQHGRVEVAGAQAGGADVVVGDDDHGQAGDLGGAAPVVGVGLEGQALAARPVGEHIGAGADGTGVVRAGVDVLAAGRLGGGDGQDGALGERGVRVAEGELDRVVAPGLDGLQRVQLVLVGV